MMDTASDSQENRDAITRDRISDLPDPIRVYILSFLSDRKAATTSMLSTKWRDLWANLPNIFLPRISPNESHPNFIDRYLQGRQYADISEFKLDCSLEYCSGARVLTWIDSVISRNVEKLVLTLTELTVNVPFTLPTTVFTSGSLRSLTISMRYVLILPEIIALPNIKILHLDKVRFSDNESFGRLVSGCPLLEDLYLSCFLETGTDDITISSQSLRHLVIRDLMRDYSGNQNTVSVEAANLISFNYEGNFASQWSLLEQQPLLTEARVVVWRFFLRTEPGEDIIAPCALNLFRSLQNVRTLVVSTQAIMAIHRAFDEIPAFENLRQLDIATWIYEEHLIGISNFLRKFPNVETLNFYEMRKSYPGENMEDDERAELEQIILANPLPRLRKITFRIGNRAWVEECVLRVVVQFAPNLERILITDVYEEQVDADLSNSLNLLLEINRYPAVQQFYEAARILELEF